MPRSKREDYPGAFHHVMNRGARRTPIFKLPDDCTGFLDTLSDTVGRFGIEVHAYSLMPNHYHLLIRSRLGDLSAAMQHLAGRYTQWLNNRHRWDGPVFRGRFKSQLVLEEMHLRLLIGYLHLNPLRANLVPRLISEAWTSHRAYLGRDEKPGWLTTGHFLGLFGDAAELHRFVLAMHRSSIEYPADFNPETGLFARKGLTREVAKAAGAQPEDRAGAADARYRDPEEVLAEVMRITGASEQQLRTRVRGPGANPARRFAIWALHRASRLTHRQIAERLDGTGIQICRLLSRLRSEERSEPIKSWISAWLADEEDCRS